MCLVFQASTCLVRLSQSHDFRAILEVYRQSEDFLSLGPAPHASSEMVLADMQHSSISGGLFCVIEDLLGRTVGVLDFVPESSEKTAVIELLMISCEHRNKGHGSSVLAALECHLKMRHRVNRIDSGVQTNNPNAIRFWKKSGFTIDDNARAINDGTVAFQMTKEI
jgi:RimJ/RimL family protein N-acetyltransferase